MKNGNLLRDETIDPTGTIIFIRIHNKIIPRIDIWQIMITHFAYPLSLRETILNNFYFLRRYSLTLN